MLEDKKYSNLLAIDSSGPVLRVGVLNDTGQTVETTSDDRYRHAEHIFGLIDKALKESGVSRSELEGTVVSTGPGSFTGLRVGLSAAKGLAKSLNIAIVGLSVFEVLSPLLSKHKNCTVILIPSRREEYYAYKPDKTGFILKNIKVLTSSDVARTYKDSSLYISGGEINDLKLKALSRIDPNDIDFSIDNYLKLGQQRLSSGGGDDLGRLVPLYIQSFPAKPG